ncbi:RluA family pseudouridine synthase [Peptostreptococcus faecalis]|uniref:RluA family pseudouridine synthase n=1 Tax=Peptostreptococcus faecalis TaxID=2045015 RepID=UPI001FA92E16|nr:RluA family pseudouridine synthase [Peptostreptococcus faecalis]
MFIEGKQKWDEFVILSEKDMKIKDLLIEELDFSVRSISRLKRKQNIMVNGEYKKVTAMVSKGDVVKIPIEEGTSDFEPQNLDTNYLYEDFDLIIADKTPYMVVHPTKSHFENTLANAVSHHIAEKGESCKIRFVNRLDMNTSGIVVVAKNAYAHHKLSLDMSKNNIKKEYIAIVEGVMKEDKGTINLPIYRESEDSIKRIVDDRGQQSITHFEVVQRLQDATIVKLELQTGRTHQIRVHLSSIGHGIIGDDLYGKIDKDIIERQSLHAFSMTLNQPRIGNVIKIYSDIPEDMKLAIEKLGGNINDYK